MASAVALFAALASACVSQVGTASAAPPLVDVAREYPSVLLDIRYATADNFFGKKVYPQARCLLRREVAPKLGRAVAWLAAHHPELRLMMKDCYRPASIQQVLWDAVKGTPKSAYVASPKSGSMHSHGAAVDLTLATAAAVELDLGTPYDFLGPRAEPRRERGMLERGELRAEHISRREILRAAMRAGGWRGIPNEWWHFDDAKKEDVRRKYPRLDIPFDFVP